MSVPERTAADADPILVVMWRGNRVQVFGDGPLLRVTHATRHVMASIADAISGAETVDAMLVRLQGSAIGETHQVEARIEAGVLRLWLRERPAAAPVGASGAALP